VIKINDTDPSIVTGAREQSTALAEINSAINQMDQTTQQNAAMVEETNAATQGLSGEAVKLEGLVRRFKTGGNGGSIGPGCSQHIVQAGAVPGPGTGCKDRLGFRTWRRGNSPERRKLERVLSAGPATTEKKGRRTNPAAFFCVKSRTCFRF
jgi:hypothetical protein